VYNLSLSLSHDQNYRNCTGNGHIHDLTGLLRFTERHCPRNHHPCWRDRGEPPPTHTIHGTRQSPLIHVHRAVRIPDEFGFSNGCKYSLCERVPAPARAPQVRSPRACGPGACATGYSLGGMGPAGHANDLFFNPARRDALEKVEQPTFLGDEKNCSAHVLCSVRRNVYGQHAVLRRSRSVTKEPYLDVFDFSRAAVVAAQGSLDPPSSSAEGTPGCLLLSSAIRTEDVALFLDDVETHLPCVHYTLDLMQSHGAYMIYADGIMVVDVRPPRISMQISFDLRIWEFSLTLGLDFVTSIIDFFLCRGIAI
jgi:hypothetical protein